MCSPSLPVTAQALQIKLAYQTQTHWQAFRSSWDFFGVKALRKQIRKCKQGSAVDLWGCEARGMLRGALCKDQLADLLVEVVCRPLLEDYLPLDYRQVLAGGRLVGLFKAPKEGVRPICIGDLFRRLQRN